MLFYNFESLDNFIKNNFIENLIQEDEYIKKIINLYANKKNVLSNVITSMVNISDSTEKNKLDDFYNTLNLLKKSLEEIDKIENIASQLVKDIKYNISLYDKNFNINENEIKANLVEYNKQREILSNKILEFENSSSSILNSTVELFFNSKNINKTKIIETTDSLKVNIETEPHDNNTLVISEKKQNAYLPFFYKDIKECFENSKYRTMQEVVDTQYIIPLDRFRNSAISRFRESFNLIKNKQHGSILSALDLGLELMFKYELNPIIIAACRNIDELDIYLDCLENNELHDFKCFEIKFEIMPKISKRGKKDIF